MSLTAAAPGAPGTLRRDLLILAILAGLLFLPGLGRRDLWNPDEARYAQVAREMRQTGSYALPHLNGEVYTQKPPLLFWSMAAFGALRGEVDETAARLPSALAAIGAILLVFRIGERLFGRRAAWLAAAAFATCFKILWQGRFGQIDMLLTALVTLGVWFWVRGYTERRPELYPLFFVCAGAATLAKGPVGLLPPLLSILAFLAVTRNLAEAKRLRIPLGLLLWAAVVLVWLVPAGMAGGAEYLQQIVYKQNVTRYAVPWHHHQPWYYYLTVIPAEFFPWSFLLPAALVVGWKRFSGRDGPAREGFLFCLCWTAATVLFFSLSPAKRTVYILTMYPAMALMVGAALDRIAADWPRDRRWVRLPLGLLAVLALLILIALPMIGERQPDVVAQLGGEPFVWVVTAAFVPLLLGTAWAWWESRSGRIARAAGGLAVGMSALGLAAALVILPRFDVIKSTRGMSKLLVQKLKPGEPYGIYPRLDSTFLVYTGRFATPLDSEQELREFAARPGRVWILAQRDDLGRLKQPLPLREVARDPDPVEGYVLLTQP
ncbi:MAG TPA: glycosyltransferase family 39 protein [Thermoanaerobaculia bacterium]|nr:glycosyltransferase family 39 protein [Thermoanaerobaculia bacterium]